MDVLATEQPAKLKLRIEAFSDLVGEDAKNVVLSQHRAAMVKAAIRTALPDIPLEALGLGPDQTKFPDQAASQANAMRRRADILIARNFAVEPDAGLWRRWRRTLATSPAAIQSSARCSEQSFPPFRCRNVA